MKTNHFRMGAGVFLTAAMCSLSPCVRAAEESGLAQPESNTTEATSSDVHQEGKALSAAAGKHSNEARDQQRHARELAQPVRPAQVAGNPPKPPVPGDFSDRLQTLIRRGPGSGVGGRSAVIRSSDTDQTEQESQTEELSIMSRLLQKAVEAEKGGTPSSVMGIDLLFSSSNPTTQNFYLEGYGALFMVTVNFPLLPSEHSEPRKEKPPVDSEWEAARQELFGQAPDARVAPGMREEYNADRVNRLRNALTETLKNATHLRALKQEEFVTICVFGGRVTGKNGVTIVSGNGGGHGGRAWSHAESGVAREPQTVMTIRAKKTEIDAFAHDKTSLEEFRKKVKVAIYAGSPMSEAGGFSQFRVSGPASDFVPLQPLRAPGQ
jgi:hypothetical protein